MEALKKKFEFDVKISGQEPMNYMASLLEKNEKQEIDIERLKLSNGLLKQMNNRSRSLIDAAKFELKAMEFRIKNQQSEFIES